MPRRIQKPTFKPPPKNGPIGSYPGRFRVYDLILDGEVIASDDRMVRLQAKRKGIPGSRVVGRWQSQSLK